MDREGKTLEKERTMIVLNVTYKCKPDMRDEFLEAICAEGIDDACRAEDGNIKYDYYKPVDGSDDLLLVEKWRDADALAAHGRQDHFVRLGEMEDEFLQQHGFSRQEVLDGLDSLIENSGYSGIVDMMVERRKE